MGFKNKEKLRQYNREYQREYALRNPEKIRKWHRISYRRNIEKRRIYDRKRYLWERGKRLHRRSEWGKRNRAYLAAYKRERRRVPEVAISHHLRNRLYNAIGRDKSCKGSLMDLLGCSIDELRKHIEHGFKERMSWKNYGRWHIDHIKPLSSFDLKIPKEQEKAMHYSNLQPLWGRDNLKKGSR